MRQVDEFKLSPVGSEGLTLQPVIAPPLFVGALESAEDCKSKA